MKNKFFTFFKLSFLLVIIKSILVDTYSYLIIITIFFLLRIAIWGPSHYKYKGWKKFKYNIKNFTQEISFIKTFVLFLFLLLPLTSASKCSETEDEVMFGSIVSHCIEYNKEYKEEYTWINILSFIIFFVIAGYFYKTKKEQKQQEKVIKETLPKEKVIEEKPNRKEIVERKPRFKLTKNNRTKGVNQIIKRLKNNKFYSTSNKIKNYKEDKDLINFLIDIENILDLNYKSEMENKSLGLNKKEAIELKKVIKFILKNYKVYKHHSGYYKRGTFRNKYIDNKEMGEGEAILYYVLYHLTGKIKYYHIAYESINKLFTTDDYEDIFFTTDIMIVIYTDKL